MAANCPGLYLYYIRARIVKFGFSKNIMSERNGAHIKDPEFGPNIILVYIWPSINQQVEVKIHKQMRQMRHMKVNREKAISWFF